MAYSFCLPRNTEQQTASHVTLRQIGKDLIGTRE